MTDNYKVEYTWDHSVWYVIGSKDKPVMYPSFDVAYKAAWPWYMHGPIYFRITNLATGEVTLRYIKLTEAEHQYRLHVSELKRSANV